MKRILCICMILVMVFSTSTYAKVNADDYKKGISDLVHKHESQGMTIIIGNETEVDIRQVANCPNGNGICDAKVNGRAFVYVNGSLVIDGDAWQCKNCYMVFATQYHPLRYTMIGNYATESYPEPIAAAGVAMFVSSIGYTSSNKLPGVRFSYR